jgi:hypothetical protein
MPLHPLFRIKIEMRSWIRSLLHSWSFNLLFSCAGNPNARRAIVLYDLTYLY